MNRAFFGSALATLLFAGQAPAQPYPSRPVTFIVPYGAGGPVDTLARILSEPMRTSLGQPVIIENVTGARPARSGLLAPYAPLPTAIP